MAKEKNKNSFVFHTEWLDSIKLLPSEKIFPLLEAISNYTQTGIEPEIEDPMIKILFSALFPRMSQDRDKYVESCKKKSEAMKKKWEEKKNTIEDYSTLSSTIEDYSTVKKTIVEDSQSSDTDTDNDTDIDINNIKEKNIKKEKTKKSTRFIPPTFEEVKAYCEERHNNVNPQTFIDHYEANGWYRGNTKMKDWKATVRTWEGRNYGGPSTPRSAVSEFFAED